MLREYYLENVAGILVQPEELADASAASVDQQEIEALISENRAILAQPKQASAAVRKLEQERWQLEQTSLEESEALHAEVCITLPCMQ